LEDNKKKYIDDNFFHISKPSDREHPVDFFLRLSRENRELYKGVNGIKSIFSNIKNYLSVFYLLLLAKIAVDEANKNEMDLNEVLIINVTYIVIKIVVCGQMPKDHKNESEIDFYTETRDSIISALRQIIRERLDKRTLDTIKIRINEINNAANVLLRSVYLNYKKRLISYHKFYKFIPEDLQQVYLPSEITESNLDEAFNRYKKEHKNEFHRDEVPIKLLVKFSKVKFNKNEDEDERIHKLDTVMCDYLTLNYPDEGRIFCQHLKSAEYSIDDAKQRKRKVTEPVPKPVPVPNDPFFTRIIGRWADNKVGIAPRRLHYKNDSDYNKAITAYEKKKSYHPPPGLQNQRS
jgi:hypothetical protein